MKQFRILFLGAVLTLVGTAQADWSPSWNIGHGKGVCALTRSFEDFLGAPGITLSGTEGANRIGLFIFVFTAVLSDNEMFGFDVSEGSLVLSVTTSLNNARGGIGREISKIDFGGTTLSDYSDDQHSTTRSFVLRTGEAELLYELIQAGDAIPLAVQFSDGGVGQLVFPADSNGRFTVWSAIFDACKEANVT